MTLHVKKLVQCPKCCGDGIDVTKYEKASRAALQKKRGEVFKREVECDHCHGHGELLVDDHEIKMPAYSSPEPKSGTSVRPITNPWYGSWYGIEKKDQH